MRCDLTKWSSERRKLRLSNEMRKPGGQLRQASGATGTQLQTVIKSVKKDAILESEAGQEALLRTGPINGWERSTGLDMTSIPPRSTSGSLSSAGQTTSSLHGQDVCEKYLNVTAADNLKHSRDATNNTTTQTRNHERH